MNTNRNNVLWGLIFIILGVGFAGNVFDLWSFSIFFPGWWTLFLIIPCAASLYHNGIQTGPLVGFSVGVMFFLSSQGFISGNLIVRLFVPVVLIIIGASIILSSSPRKTISYKSSELQKKNLNNMTYYTATFSSQNIVLDNQIFTGASINAIFGSITLRLDNSIINEDVVINCNSTFGGIEIYLPNYVNVKVSRTPLFGGVSNRRYAVTNPDAPTIYINATCMFGGVEIR